MQCRNMQEQPYIINKLKELMYLLAFHAYFYWGFLFLKGLRDVFISRSALKGN
jgi:hypothetical protein